MEISFDPAKRAATLAHRGLDFADAARVFSGTVVEGEDDRFDYGEVRNVTVGILGAKVVVIVWAERDHDRRVISMREATKGECDGYFKAVG